MVLIYFYDLSLEVLVIHTEDYCQIIHGVHIGGGKIGGYIDVQTAIAVVQLALKHRENKNLRQLINVFICCVTAGRSRSGW